MQVSLVWALLIQASLGSIQKRWAVLSNDPNSHENALSFYEIIGSVTLIHPNPRYFVKINFSWTTN